MLNKFETAIIENDIKSLYEILLTDPAVVNRPNDPQGFSPLVLASSRGMPEVIRILIRYGSPVNNLCGKYKSSALMSATCRRRIDNLQTLLQHGADPLTADGDGTLPIQMARRLGYKEIEKRLAVAIEHQREREFMLKNLQFDRLTNPAEDPCVSIEISLGDPNNL